jgi:hypothetical protein
VLARVPLGERIPFRVQEGDRKLTLLLYGAEADIDWIRYGPASGDTLVQPHLVLTHARPDTWPA